MSKYILLLISVFIGVNTYAQYVVSGTIKTKEAVPIQSGNIALLRSDDSTLVDAKISSESGSFKIEAVKSGKYTVSISAIGFDSKHLEINLESPNLDLKVITLIESTYNLTEVAIKGRRPDVSLDNNKIVLHTKANAVSAGSTVLDLLSRSPGVSVDKGTGSIALNGKEGVTVMINGRITRLPANGIFQMLDGMSAQMIEKIELIENPQAQADATGNAGAINIILARDKNLGTNASLSGTIGYGKKDKEILSTYINHRTKSLNIFLDLNFSRNHTRERYSNSRISDQLNEFSSFSTISDRDPKSTNYSGKVGIDYTISPKTTLGLNSSLALNKWQMNAINTGHSNMPDSSTIFSTKNTENNSWTNLMTNLNLTHQMSKNAKLSIDIESLLYKNKNPTEYQNNYQNTTTQAEYIEILKADKNTPINIWVSKIDYSLNLTPKLHIESGAQSMRSNLRNSIVITTGEGKDTSIDQDLSDNARLKENINAIYSSLAFNSGNTFYLNIGLRYEHTNTTLSHEKSSDRSIRKYGNLFPVISASKTIKDLKLNGSFGQRITRPSYNDLAPFVIFLDPYTYFFGNTSLQPSKSKNGKIDVQYKNLIVSISHNHERNAISRYQPIVLEESNKQVFTSINLKYRRSTSLNISKGFNISDWWSSNVSILGVHRKIVTNSDNDSYSTYFRANVSIKADLPAKSTLEVTGYYQSRSKYGISTQSAYKNLTIALQRRLSEKSKLTFTLDNVLGFNYDIYTSRDLDLNYSTNTNYWYEPRIFKLTFTQSFGNKNIKNPQTRSTGSEEIRSRVN